MARAATCCARAEPHDTRRYRGIRRGTTVCGTRAAHATGSRGRPTTMQRQSPIFVTGSTGCPLAIELAAALLPILSVHVTGRWLTVAYWSTTSTLWRASRQLRPTRSGRRGCSRRDGRRPERVPKQLEVDPRHARLDFDPPHDHVPAASVRVANPLQPEHPAPPTAAGRVRTGASSV